MTERTHVPPSSKAKLFIDKKKQFLKSFPSFPFMHPKFAVAQPRGRRERPTLFSGVSVKHISAQVTSNLQSNCFTMVAQGTFYSTPKFLEIYFFKIKSM